MPKKSAEGKLIAQGNTVEVYYTGTLEDGSVFDKSPEGKPLEFTIGEHLVLPSFENAVVGMKKGETKTITLKPTEAYGERHDELMKQIPLGILPKEIEPKKGLMLMLGSADGRRIPVTIADVGKDTLTVDLNHPLAGKTLTFKIKIAKIQ